MTPTHTESVGGWPRGSCHPPARASRLRVRARTHTAAAPGHYMTPSTPPTLPATHSARPQVRNAAAAGCPARRERAGELGPHLSRAPHPGAPAPRAPRAGAEQRSSTYCYKPRRPRQRSSSEAAPSRRAVQPVPPQAECLAPRPPRSSPRHGKKQHGTANTTGGQWRLRAAAAVRAPPNLAWRWRWITPGSARHDQRSARKQRRGSAARTIHCGAGHRLGRK